MPRTGGVYSPPSGTKGVSNTTIQSVPYNAFVDDLTADANAARPITAGGTGATSASAARTALGLAIGTNVQAYDAGLQSIAGLTTAADQMIYTTALDVYATTALTPFARTLIDDANASAARTTLGLAAVASSGSASDLSTGTIADARLPASMAGKTFTSNVNFGAGTSVADGDALLTFNGDRPWTVRQRGEDASAALSFENVSNKTVQFSCDSTYAGPVVIINPLTSSPYITIGGQNVWHAGNLLAAQLNGIYGYTPASRSIQVIAGNGLTGGGDLTANRTLTVGQGTGITVATTTVSVDTTVWRDGNQPTAAQIGSLYAGNAQGAIGTYAFALKKTAGTINPGSTVAGTDLYWSNSANSAVLGIDSGTWRAMGVITNASASVAMRIS